MIKTVFIIIGLVLCVLGLCELIHSISLLLASPSGAPRGCQVIWLRGDNAWSQLRFARLQYRWLGSAYAGTVIAVTDRINAKELELYQKSFLEGFVFCPSGALEDVIRSISGE